MLPQSLDAWMKRFFNPFFSAEVGGCGAVASPNDRLSDDLGFGKSDFAKLESRVAAVWPDVNVAGLMASDAGCRVADVYGRIAGSAHMAAWLRDDDEKAKAEVARMRVPNSTEYTGCSVLSDMQFIAALSQWLKTERPGSTLRIDRATPMSDVVGNRLDAFRAYVTRKWSDAVVTQAMLDGTVAQMMLKLNGSSKAFTRWDQENVPRGG